MLLEIGLRCKWTPIPHKYVEVIYALLRKKAMHANIEVRDSVLIVQEAHSDINHIEVCTKYPLSPGLCVYKVPNRALSVCL